MEEAAFATGDRVWRMPLWKYYSQQIQSEYNPSLLGLGGPGSRVVKGTLVKSVNFSGFWESVIRIFTKIRGITRPSFAIQKIIADS